MNGARDMIVSRSLGELAAPKKSSAVWELHFSMFISVDAWVAVCWQRYMLWQTIRFSVLKSVLDLLQCLTHSVAAAVAHSLHCQDHDRAREIEPCDLPS